MNYPMKVYQIETQDGLEWTAEFPDVSGCVGGGETPEEAMKEALENLEVHLDFMRVKGLPLPRVSIEDDDCSGKLSLRIGKQLHRLIKRQAEADGVSINQYINTALAEKAGERNAISLIESTVDKITEYITSFGTINAEKYLNKFSLGGNEYGQKRRYKKDADSWCQH